VLGGLDGVHLTGDSTRPVRGVYAGANSTATIGPDVIISSLHDGVCAKDNSATVT